MTISLASNQEKETVLNWVKEWGVLEEHETPLIADDVFLIKKDGDPVLACGMMTFEDGKYVRLYGMIKRPGHASVKNEMKILIDHMCGVAKERGYEFIQLFAPSERLAKIYEENGFRAESKALIPMRREI